ncbi:zinc-binding dehydrogenase [bacterium]|nr:zinc-binding dehydrogenase [bacterium]
MKAYLTDPTAPGGIREKTVPSPVLETNQALIEVTHFSLNRGELNSAMQGPADRTIGWDVAGTVLQAPPNGPPVGSRVVAFSRASRGWAEQVAVPLNDLALLPDSVEAATAASLPVAALTALYSLERGERILGSKVLVTGATGGVGNFAVALARLMGAEVIAQVRRPDQVESVRRLGADTVIVDDQGDLLSASGPYRLIVDGLGSRLTSKVIHSLSPDGIAVIYGVSDRQTLEIQPGFLLGSGTGRIEGFNLYRQSEIESISRGLSRLLNLMACEKLKVAVDREVGWEGAPQVARELLDRKFSGKAVVRLKS